MIAPESSGCVVVKPFGRPALAAVLSSFLLEVRYHPQAIVGPEHVGPAPAS
jgi:hypothetical protein